MSKYKLPILFILICLLFSSCTPISDEIPDISSINTNDADQSEEDGYRDLIHANNYAVWNGMVFTQAGMIINLETGEIFSACNDPLCDHTSEHCAENILKRATLIAVSPSSTKEDLVFYISRNLYEVTGDGTPEQLREGISNHQIIRYHYFSGKVEILCEKLLRFPGTISIDPKTEEIYFPCYILNENEETEVALYILDTQTKQLRTVGSYKKTISPRYAIGDTLYCMASPSDGIVYSLDLSRERLTLEQTMSTYTNVHGGYAYYKEKVGEERLYVSDDVIALCEQYGQTYKDFEIYDFYRVDITEEQAEPELIAERITEGGCMGNYVYYYEDAPEYAYSYLTLTSGPAIAAAIRNGQSGEYRLDAPNIPKDVVLFNVFSQYRVAMHILDAVTLEPVTVLDSETYEFSPSGVYVADDGAFISIYESESEFSEQDDNTRLSKSGYLRFDKPFLTDEDIIPLTLN
ncbi:MAG: hypothetical protein IJW40_07165 [Clostridia bacterium]|nr:hypothetical protein [Clostridia bacterium]